MKKCFFTLFVYFFSFGAFGQTVVGNWQGMLEVQNNKLPLTFHIFVDASNTKFTAFFDSPLQNSFNNPCSETIVTDDSVILMIKSIKGSYKGKINNLKTELTGKWTQSGYSLPLKLIKTSDTATRVNIIRPQTPHPPFPYKSEDVTYSNEDKTVKFGATFTIPIPDSSVAYFRAPIYPVVILITGSGLQDRDETIFNHKPFAVIADYLSRNGIAVLRVDDRGVGKTTGDFKNATTADFAKDVVAGINYLKSRPDVDTNNIGLIGHSEGGIIAPMVASARKDVNFIILLAGPGLPIIDLMEQQNADILASKGIDKQDILQYRFLYKKITDAILHAKDSASASKNCIDIFKKWQAQNSASTVLKTTGVKDEKGITSFTNAFIQETSTPWFKYFIQIDPQKYLLKTKCPVLALNGEKDIQVASKQNLEAIKNILNKNNNTHVEVLEIPGLNHLFQHCKTCTVAEYGQLEETFDKNTLKLMAEWIKEGRFK